MTIEQTEFAVSSNGDRWQLETDSSDGNKVVVHQANQSSGGAQTTLPVADFMKIDQGSPQHAALLELLASSPAPELSADQESARAVLGTGL